MAGILVLGELNDGKLQPSTSELLVAGRKLAETLGEEVAIALTGSSFDGVADSAIAQGADKVYLVEDPLLAEPQVDAQLAAFDFVCRQAEPTVVLIGRTQSGRDIGPRLAFRLGVGVAQDCIDIEIDSTTKRVVATRPVYGGNALSKVTFTEANPQVAVIRGKIFEPSAPDSSRSGEVVTVQPNLDPSVIKARLIETVQSESEGVRLEDAAIVISGGRGLGGPEPFESLEELAKMLGGAVGASRAACDAGWLDHSYQVGLTGKTITPDVYITVGISGASQHMAGCSGAKQLVAINKDAEANIFKEASFGVVGDWSAVLPAFIETVRELVKS
ncbi:MAG: electron transfer flavoprotein subunit alpha/FixB family protein [Chloroflexi bacterium]|nr:electron transfer flavoprotein subunit alpha/FixB family protein [Chloroflexota bacterium]